MNISTVVFDFGNVLGFFSHRQAAQQLATYSRSAPGATSIADDIHAFLFGGELEDDHESGRLSTAEVLTILRDKFDLSGSDEQLVRAYADMFAPNAEVCALVPHLKPRYRLLLLSNTNELHYRQFGAQFADTLRHFDGLVLSHEVGVRKPHAGIFHHCQRLAGAPAAECLFIDDLEANIQGARACGWQGLVYRREDDLREGLLRVGVTIG